jgi:hypothetical protein
MNDLLDNPAMQSGVIPLVLGLVLAFALARTRFLVLVPWAGFVAVVALALGFAIEPLTSVRKLVLVGLASGVLALALETAKMRMTPALRGALALIAAAAALWVAWRVLAQKDGAALWLGSAGAALYAGLLTYGLLAQSTDPLRAAVCTTVLALASGLLGLLGASISMTLMGFALGAAAGATVLVQMLQGARAPLGHFTALPPALICGLIGIGASTAGSLTWPALLPLLLLPLAPRLIAAQNDRSVWRDAVYVGAACLVPAALALVLAWTRVGVVNG